LQLARIKKYYQNIKNKKKLYLWYIIIYNRMKKVLFETHHLYYWPNFLPIIEELKRRGNYKIYVSMPKRNSDVEKNILSEICLQMEISFIFLENEQARIKKIIDQKYDIIIVGNVGQLNKIVSKNTITVMVYHGIGLKKSYYNDIDKRIDIRAVESEARFNELKNHGHENLELIGFTKLDRLFTINNKYLENLKIEMGLDAHKKNILYAPSFYPTSLEGLYAHLPEISIDFNLIIKLHAFSWEQQKYYYQHSLCSKLSKENENIFLLSNSIYDIIPYYLLSDLLITDISSTMFEYLPLNKPIIQAECYSLKFKHRILQRRFWRKMDLDRHQEIDFVYNIKDPGNLVNRVYFAIENIDDMALKRKSACEYYLYKSDGMASSRLIDSIENYNNENSNI